MKKKKVWWQLKDAKCPKCGVELSKGLLGDSWTGCQSCGFQIKDEVKNLLVQRDHNDD